MDVVESVLDGVKLQSAVFCRMELSGTWGFNKEALQGAPFHVVLSGEAWLGWPAGQSELTCLGPGDVVILPLGDPHDLMSSPGAELVSFTELLYERNAKPWAPGDRTQPIRLRLGPGSDQETCILSGVFAFGDRRLNPLLADLPRLLHLRADEGANAPNEWLRDTVRLLDGELCSDRPGAGVVAARLADILFIQAVRTYLASGMARDPGWLKGIGDPHIGRALARIHSEPDHAWSVDALARVAGMSRSRFAMQFREVVGRSPLSYLTHWRMYEAAGLLIDGGAGLATLAERTGYLSEVAFSKAFKRWAGCTPAEFKRRARTHGSTIDS